MLTELTNYMKLANNGQSLDAKKMLDMFDNANNPFAKVYAKKLKDKCAPADVQIFENYMRALASTSQSKTAGKNGVAGVVTSLDGSKKYFCDEKGFEHIQTIEKGLMGAVLYYQATSIYLESDKMNVDNLTVTVGEGTQMEHHWDESFGYFGAPQTFPLVKDGERFFAKYASARDAMLKCNTLIMNDGFLKGRAAIAAKKLDIRDEAIKTVREQWEKIIASTAISYLNGSRKDFLDDALRNHQLSEAVAFINMLKHNPTRKISDTQIQALTNKIGNNLYETTPAQILEARDELSKIMNLEILREQF
ncbi:MAG: DUF4856 domain-containing protein [Bacteroidetes bacterium]|nr:MAG: DUF4856 domain-containing protein [Bacteroidota bacterium]